MKPDKDHKNKFLSYFSEAGAASSYNVDVANKIIRNAVAVQEGHARGHDLYCNEKFVRDFVAKASQKGSLHVHLGHVSFWDNNDPFEKLIGFAKNFRYENKLAICDIYFVDNEQDRAKIDKILAYAKQYPEKFGLSIVFEMVEPKEYMEKYDEKYGYWYIMPVGDYIGDSYVMELENVYGVDIVESPAVNNGLFFSTKQKVTKNFNTDMKQKKIAKFCACQSTQLGEAVTIEGSMLQWEGELTIGTVLNIVDAEGNITVAPDGTYTTDTAEITVENGMITQIKAIMPEGEQSEPVIEQEASEASETTVAEFEAKLKILDNTIKKLEKAIESEENAKKMEKLLAEYKKTQSDFAKKQAEFSDFLNKQQTIKDMKTTTTATDNVAKFYRTFRKSSGNINALAKQGYRVKNGGKNDKSAMNRMLDNLVMFSSSLPADVRNACVEYYRTIYNQIFYIDPLFKNSTQVPFLDVYDSRRQIRDIDLPKMSLSAVSDDRILAGNDLQSCNNNTDRVIVNASKRTIRVCGSKTALYICPKEYRYLFNASIYEGPTEIPAEAIIMSMLAQRVEQEVVNELVNGNGTAPSWCNGLFSIIATDIAGAQIPSGQILTYGTDLAPFTVANVISQLTNIASKAPKELRKLANQTGVPAKMFIPYNVFEMLVEAVRGLDTAFAHSFLDACCAGWDDTQEAVKFPFATGYNLEIVPMETFNNGSADNNGGIFLVHPTEFYTGMEVPEDIAMPTVCYDCASEQIIVRGEYVSGIQYAEPKNVVVALPQTV